MSWASDMLLLLCDVLEGCLRQWRLKHEHMADLGVKGTLICLRTDLLHIGILSGTNHRQQLR